MTNLILQFAIFEIALFPILCITKRKSYIKGVQTGLPADFLANEKKALTVRPTIAKLIQNNQGTVLSREGSFSEPSFFRDLDRVRFVKLMR